MKKILFILLLFGLFFTNNAYSEEECPEGYTAGSIVYTSPFFECCGVTTCNMYIEFCCKWIINPNGNHLDIIIRNIETFGCGADRECCIRCLYQNPNVMWKIQELIATSSECITSIPPCPDYKIEVTFRNTPCVYIKNYAKYPNDYITVLVPCEENGSARCEWLWHICMDYSYNPPRSKAEFQSCTPVYPIPCELGEPSLPPDGKSFDEYWITPCFINHTCCP